MLGVEVLKNPETKEPSAEKTLAILEGTLSFPPPPSFSQIY